MASTPASTLRLRQRLLPRHQLSFSEPGGRPTSGRPFSLDSGAGVRNRKRPHRDDASRTAETVRSCAKQDACAMLAAHASRERYPSSIRPSTSCHGTVATPAGVADVAPKSPNACRAEARLRFQGALARHLNERLRLANPASSDRERSASFRIYGPPYDQLAPAACRAHPLFTGTPANRKTTSSSPLARADRACASGTVGRSSCSRGPTTQGLGHASPGAPRRATEIRHTRGAFRRLTAAA